MERLEAQMRDLTGRVEEIGNGLDQLKQRVEQINTDIDVRFSQMGGSAAAGPAPGRPGAAGSSSAANTPRFPPEPPPTGGLMPPGTVVPPPSSGGLNPNLQHAVAAGDHRRAGGPDSASTEGPPPGSSANEQFNHAFGLVKQADYAAAEGALKAFIEAHPNDPLAGNAQYWLGQTWPRATSFPRPLRPSPRLSALSEGTKAPEDLLYLGMSLAKADQKKNACLALAQLDQAFPNPAPAIRERASAERKRIGCG